MKAKPVTVHLHQMWEAYERYQSDKPRALCRVGTRAKVLTADPEQATCPTCRYRSNMQQGPDGKWYPRLWPRKKGNSTPFMYSSKHGRMKQGPDGTWIPEDQDAIDTAVAADERLLSAGQS